MNKEKCGKKLSTFSVLKFELVDWDLILLSTWCWWLSGVVIGFQLRKGKKCKASEPFLSSLKANKLYSAVSKKILNSLSFCIFCSCFVSLLFSSLFPSFLLFKVQKLILFELENERWNYTQKSGIMIICVSPFLSFLPFFSTFITSSLLNSNNL